MIVRLQLITNRNTRIQINLKVDFNLKTDLNPPKNTRKLKLGRKNTPIPMQPNKNTQYLSQGQNKHNKATQEGSATGQWK